MIGRFLAVGSNDTNQKTTLDEAIRVNTINGSYHSHEESIKGSTKLEQESKAAMWTPTRRDFAEGRTRSSVTPTSWRWIACANGPRRTHAAEDSPESSMHAVPMIW